ncbi:hypothetical protein ACHAXR_001848 [Thalassiosira sp. AJA248-18]
MVISNSRMAAVLLRNRSAPTISVSTNALASFTGRKFTRHIVSCARYNAHEPSLADRSKTTTSSILAINSHRHNISLTSCLSSKAGDDGQSPSTSDLHSLYHDQMKEIQSEREAIFGTSDNDTTNSPDLSQTAKAYFAPKDDADAHTLSSSPTEPTTTPLPALPPNWDAEEAYAEREAIFAFSEEDKTAWSNNNGGMSQIKSSHIQQIRELMREAQPPTGETTTNTEASQFTHLTPQGDGVSMVDVGHKSTSHRVALARSVVVFPPEVMTAFRVSSSNNEMIGPKGPIFETAKIAGIMGAKKTSDLIPLCHPLPLDRVNINIQLINNQAIIECECRVTHKTGVEMEALTGATIAALTIYDMVKAVSHRVEIGQTVLVSKSGGKSDFVHS